MGLSKNLVNNMGEDLIMLVGQSTVQTFLSSSLDEYMPDELDEKGRPTINIAKEVISGGVSMLFMSVMLEAIRREEKFIDYLFAGGEAVIAVWWLRNKEWVNGLKTKLSNMKGFKALQKFKLFNGQNDPTNSFISQVYQTMQTIMQGRNSSHDVANTISASNSQIDTAINLERQNLKFAELHNKNFYDSTMLKLFSGTFTEADEVILKKIIGRSDYNTTPINHEEFNKIREFMIIQDSNGKFTGLTKAFTDLLNGLGYLNK